ncbi:MAG: phospholipid carrier-dependent glycosyltransferase, partial [Pygmaiobacter sp.]
YALQVPAGTKFKLELSEGMTLNELAFKDKEGRLCTPVPLGGDAAALFDEQMLVPERPSQMNGMYFDEIYHGRTAFEMLHGLPVYETTHPPLGKDLILLGVALLGMNPLGWRIAGAVFGVAMVPVFYLLCRRLLKKRRWSAFATTLFALDFMRFTQSRIATIDVFVVFFILLATYFMLWSMQTMLRRGSKAALVPIALSGAAFGLACASKWTGLYAGAGLAVLYFSALYARWEILCAASGKEAAKPRFKKDFWIALCAGAAFFVLVPIALYLLSYLPYFLRKDEFFGLHELWECQKVMFRYHSTLTATHPFQSAWYSWPFIGRPVWYYMGTMLPAGTAASIAVLGNPVVWWGGLCGMVALALQAVRGRQTAEGSVVLISFAAQLLPWVFVSRAVFLYHYFACVPFIVLALTLTLMRLTAHHPVAARRLRIALPLVAAALFIFFYPVLAGVPISQVYAQALRLLPSWGFYIL